MIDWATSSAARAQISSDESTDGSGGLADNGAGSGVGSPADPSWSVVSVSVCCHHFSAEFPRSSAAVVRNNSREIESKWLSAAAISGRCSAVETGFSSAGSTHSGRVNPTSAPLMAFASAMANSLASPSGHRTKSSPVKVGSDGGTDMVRKEERRER